MSGSWELMTYQRLTCWTSRIPKGICNQRLWESEWSRVADLWYKSLPQEWVLFTTTSNSLNGLTYNKHVVTADPILKLNEAMAVFEDENRVW